MPENSLAIFTKASQMLAEANTIQKAKELKDLASITAGHSCKLDDHARPDGQLPDWSGIYMIWNVNSLEYIGATKNLRRRWSETHHRFRTIKRMILVWYPCDLSMLSMVEKCLIEQLNPKQNGKSTWSGLCTPEQKETIRIAMEVIFSQ